MKYLFHFIGRLFTNSIFCGFSFRALQKLTLFVDFSTKALLKLIFFKGFFKLKVLQNTFKSYIEAEIFVNF